METAAAPSASAALPSPSPARLHLLYFEGFRGRLEPVLLLLNDAGAAYSLTEVPLRDWPQLKQDSSRVPFGKLPVLKAAFGHEGKSNTIAETSAILRYLQATLRAPDMEPTYNVPIATARHDMILEASLCFGGRLRDTWSSKDCLTAEALSSTWQTIIAPFMDCLETMLSSQLYPPLLVDPPEDSRPGSSLNAAAAAAAFVTDLVANTYSEARTTAIYPSCIALRDRVYRRPRIEAWLEKSGQRRRPRVFGAHNAPDKVAAVAEQIAKGAMVIDGMEHSRQRREERAQVGDVTPNLASATRSNAFGL